MDGDDGVPLGLAHVEHHAVAQDARHVDDDVHAPPRVGHLLDHLGALREVGDVAVVGLRRPAGRLDLAHHHVGRAAVAALAVQRGAEVVHHHLGAGRRQRQRDAAPDSTPGAGHQRRLAIEHAHVSQPLAM